MLTAEQRNDVRARIAQLLDQAPTLLILDNCEHVVEAVADLVAYLVASCRQLRVVTTTRAPLAIAAERVFALGQLSEDAAADLFCQRASAARPGVPLEDEAVRRVVRRLDGLPLAIELAAAKARAMSVEDIDRRLDDRFALLRGGDRSAPDRHQTLIAVIDWSWNLLSRGRAAGDAVAVGLPRRLLAGRRRRAAGCDALDLVQSLVDQSLLTVIDAGGTVRYRMLETVREFGRMQLVGAGEDKRRARAHLAWARRLRLDPDRSDLCARPGGCGAGDRGRGEQPRGRPPGRGRGSRPGRHGGAGGRAGELLDDPGREHPRDRGGRGRGRRAGRAGSPRRTRSTWR